MRTLLFTVVIFGLNLATSSAQPPVPPAAQEYDGSASPPPAPPAPPAPAAIPATTLQPQPCNYDQTMLTDCACDRCQRCRGCWCCGLDHTTCCLGTCDMYQHYPYRPEFFGYYYFRPYNYVNVFEHKAQVVQLGGDPLHPYSVTMFDPIYAQFNANTPPLPPLEGSARPLGSKLPKLEDLLEEPAEPPMPNP